ncbi:hypothetical protein PSET11_00576 [Arthrobacter ulcerisalmonis]|uniref:Uncharacterized protein n=1 Tax=Arthrobacter ulcerisalmonis TaxID=2483813 RepID=A0A3P5WKX4_9MICC|nr:hypothetical protein PSET11_00576 [Arthrobacter ulcerisalmonis]
MVLGTSGAERATVSHVSVDAVYSNTLDPFVSIILLPLFDRPIWLSPVGAPGTVRTVVVAPVARLTDKISDELAFVAYIPVSGKGLAANAGCGRLIKPPVINATVRAAPPVFL